MSMVTGARQVLTEAFDPDESLELIERERATVLHGFDTHYKELVEAHERAAARRRRACAPASSPPACRARSPIARRARKALRPLVSGYGMSEFGVGAAHRRARLHRGAVPARPRASARPATRSAWSIPTRGAISRAGIAGRDPRARLHAHARLLQTSPRRPPRPSTPTAGCTPATWACCAPTATCASWAATRTCSRSAARTSTRWRSRPISCATRPSTWPRSSSYPDARLSEVGVAFVRCEPGHDAHRGRRARLLPRAHRELQDPAPRRSSSTTSR